MKHKSLIMIFSDLLTEPEGVIRELHNLKHGGNDVILFHILDAAEALFPFHGMVDFKEQESGQRLIVDSDGVRADYMNALEEFCSHYREDCLKCGVDYVLLHTGMPFDRALMEYLQGRSRRG